MTCNQTSSARQLDPSTRIEPGRCDKHGAYEARVLTLMADSKPIRLGCPTCAAIHRAEVEAREQQRAQREAEMMLRARVGAIGIPARFSDRTLDSYIAELPGQIRALEAARTMAESSQPGISLILCGAPGSGKTHLACGIGLRFAQNGKTALFRTVLGAVRHIKDTYRHGSERSESEAIADLIRPDLLILDEVGVQTGSEHEKMLVFEIVNERYQQNRSTILISNLTPAELSAYLGDRLIDRFREGGGVIAFDWESWRGRRAA